MSFVVVVCVCVFVMPPKYCKCALQRMLIININNILYSSQQEIKAVIQS